MFNKFKKLEKEKNTSRHKNGSFYSQCLAKGQTPINLWFPIWGPWNPEKWSVGSIKTPCSNLLILAQPLLLSNVGEFELLEVSLGWALGVAFGSVPVLLKDWVVSFNPSSFLFTAYQLPTLQISLAILFTVALGTAAFVAYRIYYQAHKIGEYRLKKLQDAGTAMEAKCLNGNAQNVWMGRWLLRTWPQAIKIAAAIGNTLEMF